ERVRSTPGDDVDKHPGGLHCDIGASRRDLHLFDGVEVDDKRTPVGDVVPVDAVDEPPRLPVTGASGEHAGLLAVVGPSDVLTIAGDTWCLGQHLEHITGRGNRLQFLNVEARPLGRAPDIDDRVHARYDHLLLQAGNLELRVDLCVEPTLKLKPLAPLGSDAGYLEPD